MAEMRLQFLIDAKNRTDAAYKKVQKNMDKVSDKLKAHQKAFKMMAVAGVAAMGAITLAMGTAIKEAAKAEGSYNKFNAVFGEHKDDMLLFVDDIRTRMPTATHEIVRMAANLQDLLVPLGLSRELAADMTKGFLEVSNQIAAFNDVDPTEVIEAIGSALAGSSEPLRRFGVNALETSLEAKALEMGLLGAEESFATLDPEVKMQIRSQALLAQIIDNSADAIAGFEENNDSFIRRQQELNATIKEAKKTLGDIFLPVVDDVLKKVLPLVSKFGEWVEVNPELARTIIVVTTAVAGLVAVLGTLGLILPKIIALFGIIFSPIGLVIGIIVLFIAQLVAMGIQFKYIYDKWNEFLAPLWPKMKELFDNIKGKVQEAIDFFKFAGSVVWEAIQTVFNSIFYFLVGIGVMIADFLRPIWEPYIEATRILWEVMVEIWTAIKDLFVAVWNRIKEIVITVWNTIKEKLEGPMKTLKEAWVGAWGAMKDAVVAMWDAIKGPIESVLDKLNAVKDAAIAAWNWMAKVAGGVAERGREALESRQYGGYIPETKPYLLHRGETVIPAGAGMGGITVNIMGGNYLSREAATMFGEEIANELKRNIKL